MYGSHLKDIDVTIVVATVIYLYNIRINFASS